MSTHESDAVNEKLQQDQPAYVAGLPLDSSGNKKNEKPISNFQK